MGLRNLSRAWSPLIPYPNRVLIQLSLASVVDIQRGLRTGGFRSRVSILGKDYDFFLRQISVHLQIFKHFEDRYCFWIS